MDYFKYLEDEKNIKLNDEQKAAVSFDKGNALVLSTAGSGKTTVIVSRAGRLMYEGKCKKKILTVTFSKMAADDMKKRFNSVFGNEYIRRADFSTIHAFLYRIIMDYCRKTHKNLNLLSNNFRIIEAILKDQYKKEYYNIVNDDEIENVISKISFVKNMMLKPDDYSKYSIDIKNFDKIIENYDLYKKQNSMMDFDDVLYYGLSILREPNGYISQIKNTYDFIQIDEMQDTSKLQHEIIKLIADNNLFMVGDDDQSIYSFRGSFPEYMMSFKKNYPNGQIFYLKRNYRSDGNIVNVAKKFIKNNTERYKKPIESARTREKEVNVVKMPNRALQGKFIIKDIKKYSDKKIGILYRNNISSLIIANMLNDKNIDFFIKDDKTKFFKSFVLYDVLSFIKLSKNNKDREAFAKIYYKSYTYFTKAMCNFVLNYKEDLSVFTILKNFPGLEYYMFDKIDSFRYDIDKLSYLKPNQIISFIKNNLEYISYLERLDQDGRNNLSSTSLILEILDEISQNCNTIEEFLDKINSLQSVLTNAVQNKSSLITLSSIHSSKGLEYDVVYLIDNIDKEFPLDKKNESDEEYLKYLEEERRIFYVGLTRAKDVLNILAPGVPSIFVDEIIK